MNLIDFVVKEIVSETRAKMWKLYGYSHSEMERFKDDESYYEYLNSNGCRQTYKYVDEGGYSVNTEYFNLDRGEKPYHVGHRGQH